ncbi:hypothetical protein D917_08976 [Trichinella nativa]|uniref:Uncharacterized protein n=1 Tax=Trichinella nativa TaxID=6335 RepID=A0A1Y3EHF9_9BILA|nr:hypothetical protein D917_08976 [Trichinella nativa]
MQKWTDNACSNAAVYKERLRWKCFQKSRMLLLWIVAALFSIWMPEAASITETLELIEYNLETINGTENYATERRLPAYYTPRLYAGVLQEIVSIDAQNMHGRILSDYKIVKAKDNNTYFVCKSEKCFSCLKALLTKMKVILKDHADKNQINELWNVYQFNRTLLPCFYENMEETRCQKNREFTKQEFSDFVKNITSKRLLTCEEQNRKYNFTLPSRKKRTPRHGTCYTLKTPVHIFRSNNSEIIYEAYENEENSNKIKIKPISTETVMLKVGCMPTMHAASALRTLL